MSTPYLTLAKNIVASNLWRLDFPYKLTYAITYLCNYRCKTCNIWKKSPSGELSLKEIQEFFHESHDFSWIDLTGGEVFLRKDFIHIVEAVLSNCSNLLLLHFPTNGYLTDHITRTVEKIMSWKPVKLIITVSMDGDETLNDEIRGIKGGWRHQIETFKQLHAIQGVKVVLGMTLSAHNADRVEPSFEAAKKECAWLNYEDFHVNIAQVSGHFFGNQDDDPFQDHTEIIIKEIKKYMKHRGMPWNPVTFLEREYLKRIERYLKTDKTPVHCHALKSSCFLDPSGTIYPCGMYDCIVGNLKDAKYRLSQIWKSDKCLQIQKEIWGYKCPNCWTPCEAYQSILGSMLRIHP